MCAKDMVLDEFDKHFFNLNDSVYYIILSKQFDSKNVFSINSVENADELNKLIIWLHSSQTNSTVLIFGDDKSETLAIKKYIQCIINDFDEQIFDELYPETSSKLYNKLILLQ